MEAKEIDNIIWAVIQQTCGRNEVQPSCVSKLDRAIFKAGIKEVVDIVKEIAIMGYKEGELGVKPPTDLVLDLYLWNKNLKEWGIDE